MTSIINDIKGQEDHTPVKVVVTNPSEQVREFAPELSAFNSWELQGTEVAGASMQVLPQDTRRHKAHIYVTSTVPTANAYVVLGKREQVMNGQGFRLYSGQRVTVESQAAVWLAADGVDPITVSVLDERYVK